MQSTSDLREHVDKVDHATDTCAYFIEFSPSHICTLEGKVGHIEEDA